MSISIRDDQGLDTALMMEGYSSEQRQEAKRTIRVFFAEAASKVFQDILEKPLPETMIVNMAISNNEELHGESAARLAWFNVALSHTNAYSFTILEITVKTILNHDESTLLESTVIHEMFHAADLNTLENNLNLFKALQNDIYSETDIFSKNGQNADIALLKTLQVFGHYRAEGIAILGESLLMKRKFGSVVNATARFCSVFEMAMIRAQMRMSGHKEGSDAFDKEEFHAAYAVAPIILLQVMDKKGDISHELVQKALDGLGTGHYELTESDIKTVMRSAMALTLTGYIQGLISLGDEVAPIRPFLNFCAMLQQDGDEENMIAYEQLTLLPISSETFNAAMNQILGYCMSEEELDGLFWDFMVNTTDEPLYPQMKEKVSELYSIYKNDSNPDFQLLAQWALTYYFDEEDIIYDEISAIGYVDDMTVIDYAIKLLQ